MAPKRADMHPVETVDKWRRLARKYKSELKKKREELKQVRARVPCSGDDIFGGGALRSASNVECVVRIGTCPSAGGSRFASPEILSHVSLGASQKTVEFYRFRIWRYLLELDASQFSEACAHGAGLCVKFDETPMRVYRSGKGVVSTSALALHIACFRRSGDVYIRLPSTQQPNNASSEALFAALKQQRMGAMELLAGNEDCWTFVLFVTDMRPSNSSAVRRFMEETERAPGTIILRGSCWARNVNKAAKYSFGSFPLGSLLRLSHYLNALNAKPLTDLVDHCREMLLKRPLGKGNRTECVSHDECRRQWEAFCAHALTEGPFKRRCWKQRSEALINRLCALFPHGLPLGKTSWVASPGESVESYASALGSMFATAFPTPTSSRFYAAELSCWRAFALHTFGILSRQVSSGAALIFWPGDDIAQIAEEGNTGEEDASLRRMGKIKGFVGGQDFLCLLSLARLGSVPRWAFAQTFHPDIAMFLFWNK